MIRGYSPLDLRFLSFLGFLDIVAEFPAKAFLLDPPALIFHPEHSLLIPFPLPPLVPSTQTVRLNLTAWLAGPGGTRREARPRDALRAQLRLAGHAQQHRQRRLRDGGEPRPQHQQRHRIRLNLRPRDRSLVFASWVAHPIRCLRAVEQATASSDMRKGRTFRTLARLARTVAPFHSRGRFFVSIPSPPSVSGSGYFPVHSSALRPSCLWQAFLS